MSDDVLRWLVIYIPLYLFLDDHVPTSTSTDITSILRRAATTIRRAVRAMMDHNLMLKRPGS